MRKRSPEAHPNGNFYARIKGKRINLGRNLQKAKVRLRQLEAELAKGALVVGGAGTTQVTFGGKKDIHIKELAVRHLEWTKENRASKTFVTRQHYVCLFLDFIGDRMVSEIAFADLDAFYAHCRKHHSRGGNGGSHSMRELKTFLRWGEEFEICDVPVRRFPAVKKRPPRAKNLSEDDLAKLLDAAEPDMADLVRFAVATGLRPQELREIKKTDIQIANGTACIRIGEHKTDATARTYMARSLPLTPETAEIVSRQMRRHPKTEFVFLNGNEGLYTCDTLRRRMERLSRRAGLEKKTPYCCRHSFGTALGANGVNLAVIAQLMGHSDIHTTTRYIANNDLAHVNAVAVMDKIIPPAPQKTVTGKAHNKADSAVDFCI